MRLGSRIIVAAAGAAILVIALVPVSRATSSFSFTRVAGADRYATAAAVATDTFGTSPIAVLTTGERFPDALSGAYVAGVSRAPIVLTRRDALPAATAQALQTLRTARVFIVGGTDAVSADVEADLQRRNITTERIAGADRYETAARSANVAGSVGPGVVAGSRTAVVASGENFPDALAAGPLSYGSRLPLLLTPRTALAAATRDALTGLGIRQVVLPGGTAAVSAEVESAIQALGVAVVRVAGADRTDTAARLADWSIANAGFSRTHVNLARGDDFADALAGGPHGGSDGPAPIVLTITPSTLGAITRAWIAQHADTLAGGHVFGGLAAVSQATENDAVAAARSKPGGPTTTTEPVPSPKFQSWAPGADATSIRVTYDEPIACDSVDADGSVYRLELLTGPGSPDTYRFRSATCDGPALGMSATVVLTLQDGATFRPKQTSWLTAHAGTDGDSVKDGFGREQSARDGLYINYQ